MRIEDERRLCKVNLVFRDGRKRAVITELNIDCNIRNQVWACYHNPLLEQSLISFTWSLIKPNIHESYVEYPV